MVNLPYIYLLNGLVQSHRFFSIGDQVDTLPKTQRKVYLRIHEGLLFSQWDQLVGEYTSVPVSHGFYGSFSSSLFERGNCTCQKANIISKLKGTF